ncbi:A-kinase anchor protein 7-like [Mytilus galloprovincialis]|uniref:A-kinase anchor protein 7-like n=1 Tax=Mytilus galloprovincialis TaxID=29158 RepID=UPI003F7C5D08
MASSGNPTHFVAIQITDPEIKSGVQEVQNYMCQAYGNLRNAMVPIETLHLTLRLACLENDDIPRMMQALDQAATDVSKDNGADLILDVKDIGNFDNKVVYAKVQEDESLSRVARLSDILETCCQTYDVPQFDVSPFNPHISIARLSRLKSKQRKIVKTIEPSSYIHYMNTQFGTQLVTCLQLCSMKEEMDVDGYYHVSHRTQIN